MSAQTKKPTILIIHGAFMLVAVWDSFREKLTQAGYESICPKQPTTNDRGPADQKATVADDAKVIQDIARDLIAQGRQIVVMPHSYGGIVACSALTDDLFATKPDAPGITHILWTACWMTPQGKSVGDIMQKHGMQTAVDLAFNPDGTAYANNPAEGFFADYNAAQPEKGAQLVAETAIHNWGVTMTPAAAAPWKHASTYVLCTQDKAIFPPLQRGMVEDVVAEGGVVEIVELEASHCPFLSRQEELLGLVEKVAAA